MEVVCEPCSTSRKTTRPIRRHASVTLAQHGEDVFLTRWKPFTERSTADDSVPMTSQAPGAERTPPPTRMRSASAETLPTLARLLTIEFSRQQRFWC